MISSTNNIFSNKIVLNFLSGLRRVIFNGMPNITVNYSDCHLSAEICMFGNDVDRCSVNLVVIPLASENKY